jgi:hypothetical protein
MPLSVRYRAIRIGTDVNHMVWAGEALRRPSRPFLFFKAGRHVH